MFKGKDNGQPQMRRDATHRDKQTQQTCAHRHRDMRETATGRGGIRLCGAPGSNVERGPFYMYETVVNGEIVNERTEVVVLLKQKRLEQKEKRIVN